MMAEEKAGRRIRVGPGGNRACIRWLGEQGRWSGGGEVGEQRGRAAGGRGWLAGGKNRWRRLRVAGGEGAE